MTEERPSESGGAASEALPDVLEEAYRSGALPSSNGESVPVTRIGVEPSTARTLARLTRERDARRTLETGMAHGLSALAIGAVHAERGEGEHLCIDPAQAAAFQQVGVEAIRKARLSGHVRLIEQPSELALPRLLGENHRLDLAFVDGLHLYDQVLIEFFYIDRMLEVGGCIALHDTWMTAVQRALAFVLANRAYDRLPGRSAALDSEQNLAILVKRGEDDREWDFDRPFDSSARARTAPPERSWRPPAVRRPALSLCMTSGGDPARTRAILELVRPHVDEIVLGVNRPQADAAVEGCRDLCDRLLTYELDRNPSHLVAWINHQCAGDWIWQLDDDEVPGAALLEAIPDLIVDRWQSSYRMRRRWLYGSPEQWLSGMPWEIDYIARLHRNLPGSWTASGSVHSMLEIQGTTRFLQLPYYHLDLLLTTPEQRRAKARRYGELGRIRANEIDVNAPYFPERQERLDLRTVPPADVALIEPVLDPAGLPPPGDGPEPEHCSWAEITRWSWARPISDDARRGRIGFVEPRRRVTAGGKRLFFCWVENLGSERWSTLGVPWVRVHAHWLDEAGSVVLHDEACDLPGVVHPGHKDLVPVNVTAPPFTGSYQLELVLSCEGIAEIGQPVRTPVEVVPSDDLDKEVVRLSDEELRRMADRFRLEARDAKAMAAVARAEAEAIKSGRRYRAGSMLARPVELWRRLRAGRT